MFYVLYISFMYSTRYCAALNFYAQDNYQKAIGVDCRLSITQSTISTFLREVTCAINDHLLKQWIRFPTTPQKIQQAVQR